MEIYNQFNNVLLLNGSIKMFTYYPKFILLKDEEGENITFYHNIIKKKEKKQIQH